MQTVYIGNTLINDVMLGSQRMDDVLQKQTLTVEYLMVAAGGAGGTSFGGGGGAGGLLSGSSVFQLSGTYPIVIGQGLGSSNGGNTTFNSLTAVGGGRGGRYNLSQTQGAGQSGGSGGGGARDSNGNQSGGSGTIGQGFGGGNCTGQFLPGGGGGAGQAGQSGNQAGGTNNGGNGGNGLQSAINGTLTYYAGGGAGRGGSVDGTAGLGGGGAVAVDGTANTGGGGGANGGTGGSGIVILRYLGPEKATGGTVTTNGNYIVHTFTASGDFNINL